MASKKNGTPSGSSTHITLHEVITTLACLESTLNYFSQATHPFYPVTLAQNLGEVSGFTVKDGKVEFGMPPPAEGSAVAKHFFVRQ